MTNNGSKRVQGERTRLFKQATFYGEFIIQKTVGETAYGHLANRSMLREHGQLKIT